MAVRRAALALAVVVGALGVGTVGGSSVAGAAATVTLASVPLESSNCWYANTWGAGRSGDRHHQGVDIIAKAGTPVYAATAGRVLQSQGSLAGNQIKLVAADGTYFIYAHLSAYENTLAPHGAPVQAGTVIGYVGRTGNTTVNHLHFEVHPNGGKAVDPTPVVAAASTCGEQVSRQALGSSSSTTTTTTTTPPKATTTTTPPKTTTTTPPKATKPSTKTPATTSTPTTQAPASSGPTKFSPAVRVLAPTGPVAADKTIGVKVVGFPGIPASARTAEVTITLTAKSAGKAAVWPCGQRAGLDSGTPLDAVVAGRAVSTRVTLAPGEGGRICLVADVPTTVSVSVHSIS